MTGSVYRSVLVAAFFALHPLNVDTVAWVAERKNLLSTFFWMTGLLAYSWYTEKPGADRYLLTLIVFALGLMVKPMLVTFPFVLLLLDYWPLKRLTFGRQPKFMITEPQAGVESKPSNPNLKLFGEKIPFLVLSVGSVWLSISSLQHFNNMVDVNKVPMMLRISNALVSYISYIVKMFWPVNLAVYYPFPNSVPLWQTAGSVLLLTAATGFCVYQIKHKPYLAVGWLWYLGTLLPVSGLVQSGLWPEMADRWSYVPLIGLFIVIAWGIPDALHNWRFAKPAMVSGALAVIVSLFIITSTQLNHWENSKTLFEHALKVTSGNAVAHNNLGNALLDEGQAETALHHFQAALRLEPNYAGARNNIGNALVDLDRVEEAIGYYRESIEIDPLAAKTHNNLAVALTEKARLDEAVMHLQEALRLKPDYAEAYHNLGAVYGKKAQVKKAAKFYLTAIRLRPEFPQPYNNLGLLLWRQNKLPAAIDYFRQALKRDPGFTAAANNLHQAQAALDALEATVVRLQKARNRNPGNSDLHIELGDLYKAHNRLNDAVKQYQRGLAIRPDSIALQSRVAMVHAMKGQYDEAIDLLKVLVKRNPHNTDLYYNLAGIYSRNNQLEDSIHWLKMAIAKGFNNWEQIKVDRNFENLRGTSFFQALAHKR
jgi:tetratricopeptide (TPR) repeat protein